MTQSARPSTPPTKRSSSGLFLLLVAMAIVLFIALRTNRTDELQLGDVPLPPLEVEGWFNTTVPVSNESLRGKVVLADCWFVDCRPCQAAIPHLVEFYNRFHDQGLVLVGLTPDSGSDATRAQEFVKSIPGLDWPIGYGARIPLEILGIQAFPTLILFDKSGHAVWASHGTRGLEEAVLQALAR